MSFKAKFDGWCGECREPIVKDDELEWLEGSVVHADCLADAVRDEAPRPTCSKCWQVTATNGSCGCDPE